MNTLIVGGAGFIGSVLASELVASGNNVLVVDKLSLGKKEFLNKINVKFFPEDINNIEKIIQLLKKEEKIDEVWHLAANSDISLGQRNLKVDLNDTFMSTVSLLEIMKKIECYNLHFSSSSAVYGVHKDKLKENSGPLIPISNYGAMKLASEAIISSFFESHLKKVSILRFPNVVGVPATHGVILDFISRLKKNPSELNVLGNGKQKKPYIHVGELVNAMIFIRQKINSGFNLFNIGPNDDGITVREIAEATVKEVSPRAKIYYQDKDQGWVGDVPSFSYSIDKLKDLGWSPNLSSKDTVAKAIKEISIQEEV